MIHHVVDTTTTGPATARSKHRAAIELNNLAVSNLIVRGCYKEAVMTLRIAINLIKSCIANNDTTTNIEPQRIVSHDEINRILHDSYQRAEVAVAESVLPTVIAPPSNSGASSSETAPTAAATTPSSSHDHHYHPTSPINIQIISSHLLPMGSVVAAATSAFESVTSTEISECESSSSSSIDHNDPPMLLVYPMTIECDQILDDAGVICDVNDKYEYHSVIFLYNYGILYQCISILNNETTTNVVEHSCNSDSIIWMRAASHIFRMTFQWLNQQLQPMGVLENFDGENITTDTDMDIIMSKKCLQMMILINYNMIQVSYSHRLHSEYESHCNTMNKLLLLVSTLQRFNTASAA